MYFHFLENNLENSPSELIENNSNWLYDWGTHKTRSRNIGEFKKVNLFVGANNSGKSRFLRGLIKSEFNFIFLSNSNISLQEQFKDYQEDYPLAINKVVNSERGFISKTFNSIQNDNPYFNLIENYQNYQIYFEEFKKNMILAKSKYINAVGTKKESLRFQIEHLTKVQELIRNLDFIRKSRSNTKNYIPILRTIQENDHLQNGNIKETIKKNYGIDKNVFTGLELYKEVMKLKTSVSKNRDKVEKFEEFLSNHFFNKKRVVITSNSETKQLLCSIDEVEHPIFDIGDGIQALIILLFPIFTANNNDWFFIEEPEMNLHPGLQRIFIETLLNDEYLKTKNLKYFFTTHSNHFLDITLNSDQISIFQFKKSDANKFSIKTNVKPDKETLDVLGVNTSSVFLANTSIWVEGPTDRKYISKLLKLYLDSKEEQPFKEDIDFAFFEYGGNLIEHYLFGDTIDFNEDQVRSKINSFALSNKIFLLADNDGADDESAKGKRRKTLENLSDEKANFCYKNTVSREIENLLPKRIIKEFVLELVKGDYNLEKIKLIDFTREDYKNIGLGNFYEKLLIDNGLTSENLKSFKAPSGTLMNDYKMKLSNFVINCDYKYEDFIEENIELKELIESLYSFIKL
ncbi:AAA family ATPase [Thalassobellus citreus]|uniref:AAA family ATPase n=1 Tax=Thalassobellus citreus TaxID=3367752 RepID=UPI0037AAE23E